MGQDDAENVTEIVGNTLVRQPGAEIFLSEGETLREDWQHLHKDRCVILRGRHQRILTAGM